ncbi:hypothetical protein J2X46_003589 [Nocardioides sp. BE266]|uniref:matrixin family metalloprotease n=1 Tax=Nocardioides sp. BE266 TaxID=2817725 RepID=UPI00285C1729|nr:matrixin family metalloprotease [Nocardioides sp. BE266]MDR7254596.1 hypothetical protein [Nocardioides sp. BE266]
MRRLSRTPVLAAVAMLATSTLTVSLLAAPAEAGGRKTRVSAALSATATNPGGAVVMSGRIKDKGKQKRRVVLEQKIASGWRTVGKTSSAKDGSYAIAVPTTWFYSSKLRTRVKPTRKLRGKASRAHRLSVVPAYVPGGSPDSWDTLGQSLDRWNPCRTLTYGINTSRATPDPATVSTGIHNTIALVSQATGVRFKFVGETASNPLDKKWKRSDPDIIFGWTTDAETPLDLGPNTAARGGYDRTLRARDARGRLIWEAIDGGVIYDLTDTATMNATEFQQLTLHEVGHVMGLGHVAATDQYMTAGAELYYLPLQYQAGDLNGLSKVGLQAGCTKRVRYRGKVELRRVAPVATTLD